MMVNTLGSLADFDRLFLGFDRMKHELANHGTTGNYPRYNIVKSGEDQYRIEMDLAGWDKKQISVVQDDRTLTVDGKGKDSLSDDERFIFKGISSKNFRRIFTLGEYVMIEDASMENGLLVIKLNVETPDEEKPKFIDIN
jgi:molecular chaperone IbpA